MSNYYPTGMQSIPLATIRRERLLPVPGEVLAQPGDRVVPTDVVARCELPGKVWVIDLGKALGVRREWAAQYVRQGVGDTVRADEILAVGRERLGRPNHRCLAPVAGQVIAINSGFILIETPATTLELDAQIEGQVADIIPERGVVIAAAGALIQARWGSGGEAFGPLRTMVEDPAKPLVAKSFASARGSCRGVLAVGGHILGEGALEEAAEAQVGGLIVGSVDAGLRAQLQSLPFPVLVTEGFGALSMSQEAFALLQAHEGREAILSAGSQARWGTERPEVLIPLDSPPDVLPKEPGPRPLQIGMRVRGLRAPYQGVVATITNLPASPKTVESGVRLPVAEVELDSGESAYIPLANLQFSH